MTSDLQTTESEAEAGGAVVLVGPCGQALLEELARAPEGLALRIRGDCMEPVLHQGDRVTLRARRLYLPGDLVAVRGAGGLLVHRFLGYRPRLTSWEVWTRADRGLRPDRAAPLADVLGRVEDLGVPLRSRLVAVGSFVATALSALRRRLARLVGVGR